MNEEEYIQELYFSLKRSIEKIQRVPIALAFSGGVDSSIIAKLLKDSNPNFTCYVAGIPNCSDFISSELVAKELDLNLKKIVLNEEIIEEAVLEQVKILSKLYEEHKRPVESLNPVTVSSNIYLLLVEKYCKEKVIISGLGADTLLGSFARFKDFGKEKFIEELKKDSEQLLKFDYLEDVNTADFFNKTLITPFIEKETANILKEIPYELKRKDGIRKYILRRLAEYIGLSKETAYREKKSAQYGSGIMKIIERLAKKKKMSMNDYIQYVKKLSKS